MSLRHIARFLNPDRECTMDDIRDIMSSSSFSRDNRESLKKLAYSKTDDEMALIVALSELGVRNLDSGILIAGFRKYC